jgi:2-polyprenyl-3-methyl-5-hydroxy-6-metoxy-1,4-benzoquinol methylase
MPDETLATSRPPGRRSMATPAANIGGNYYDKYHARNPIARRLMAGFLDAFDELSQSVPVRTAYEVGCGEGQLALRLLRRGVTVRGCDLDAPVVETARRALAEAGYTPELSARSVYDVAPGEAAADLVVCCEVLEHVPEPALALRVLAREARPHLLLSVPREPIWRVLNMARGRYLGSLGNTPGHLQHWSTGAFVELVGSVAEVLQVRTPLPWTMILARVAPTLG